MAGVTFLDILSSATGTQPYYTPEEKYNMERRAKIEDKKIQTLFDTMVEDRKEKRIKEYMGRPGQNTLPPDIEGPQVFGTGLHSPERGDQLEALALMTGADGAFANAFTSSLMEPSVTARTLAQTRQQGQNAQDLERLRWENDYKLKTTYDPQGNEQLTAVRIDPDTGQYSTEHLTTGKRPVGSSLIETPLLEQIMARGYMPTQRLTGQFASVLEGMLQKHIDWKGQLPSVQDMRDMELQAWRNRTLGRTAASRLVGDAASKIPLAVNAMESYKEAAGELGLHGPKLVTAAKNAFAKGMNDPKFYKLMAARNLVITDLGEAMKRTGLTDAYQRLEEAAFDPNMSEEAFQAYMEQNIRAVRKRAEFFHRVYGYEFPYFGLYNRGGEGGGREKMPPKVTLEDGYRVMDYNDLL